MGIETNTYTPSNEDANNSGDNAQRPFAGTTFTDTAAPTGALDLMRVVSMISLNQINPMVDPYLQKVLKAVNEKMTGITLINIERPRDSYAFQYTGPDGVVNLFGIQFVSLGAPKNQDLTPASLRLVPLNQELRRRFEGRDMRVVDARIIIADYQPEMDRTMEMANCIVSRFSVVSDPAIRNLTASILASNEFVLDWSLSEARNLESQLSPHGVRPRMDVAVTLKAKIRTPNIGGRPYQDYETEYQTIGVMGGYVEIGDLEDVQVNGGIKRQYRPMFHITVANATIPIEGVFDVMLGVLAPVIYKTSFYGKQWQNMTEAGASNPGMLEEDRDNRGKPLILKDQEELAEFIREMFAQPVITVRFQDGRDSIPGVWRIGADAMDERKTFIDRTNQFFGAGDEQVNFPIGAVIDKRFEGVYGDPAGVLRDSRDIDYLYVAAKSGWGSIDQTTRRMLLRPGERQTDRARLIDNVTNSFNPLYLDTIVAINPPLVSLLLDRISRAGIVITDPNSQQDVRPLGSFLGNFESASNIGTVVQSGPTNRGLNITSAWNYQNGRY